MKKLIIQLIGRKSLGIREQLVQSESIRREVANREVCEKE